MAHFLSSIELFLRFSYFFLKNYEALKGTSSSFESSTSQNKLVSE